MSPGVLLRRCAWHSYYRGYPVVFGIARWGLGLGFTDGVCRRCAARLRRDLELEVAASPWLRSGTMGVDPLPVPPAAVVAIALALLLALASPLADPPPGISTAGLARIAPSRGEPRQDPPWAGREVRAPAVEPRSRPAPAPLRRHPAAHPPAAVSPLRAAGPAAPSATPLVRPIAATALDVPPARGTENLQAP